MIKTLVAATTLSVVVVFAAPASAMIVQIPDVSEKLNQPASENVHYRSFRHRHTGSRYIRTPRRERRSAQGAALPQAHIDFCSRQNMGYRVFDNTIALDRFTRRQCASPFYRP